MTRRQCFIVARRNNAAADLLRAIAAEDRVHDVPLWQLRAGLPDLTLGEHILAATQHLHLTPSAGIPHQVSGRIGRQAPSPIERACNRNQVAHE